MSTLQLASVAVNFMHLGEEKPRLMHAAVCRLTGDLPGVRKR
jgi:hypothetical protein